jgi:hypothetical protein
LELPERLAATLVSDNGLIRMRRDGASLEVLAPAPGRETEEGFLVACLALPREAREVLAEVTAETHFTSGLARRAIRHLSEHLDNPDVGLEDDPDLAAYLGRLRQRPAQEPVTPIPVARVGLELSRLERAIAVAAHEQPSKVAELATERERVRRELADLLAKAAGES